MSEVRGLIEAAVPGATIDEIEHRGELTIEVEPDRIVDVARFLAAPPLAFNFLSDVSCADFPETPGRFRVAYHLFSMETGARLRLRAWAGADDPQIDSVAGVWPTADWLEREVFDLFGVRFRGHPDLTRILMPLDWVGHPLRRDYPVGGEEVEFSDAV
ncbi:MAG: NADH-quinone oxidoreductase subunit C [Actinomycetota bacterium]